MATGPVGSVLQKLRRVLGRSSAAESSDGHLLERFTLTRDETAFAELVRRHGGMVQRVCQAVLRCAHDAEDAFQATFLVLARKSASVRQRDSVASWLYGVAYRIAVRARSLAARRRAEESRAPARTEAGLGRA